MKILFVDSKQIACYKNHEMQFYMNLANNLSLVSTNTVHMISILNKYSTTEQPSDGNVRYLNLEESSNLEYDIVFLFDIEKELIYLSNITNVRKVVLMITSMVTLNMPFLQKLQSFLILCYSSLTLQNKIMSHYYLNHFHNVVFPVSVSQPVHNSLFFKENIIGLLGSTEEMDRDLLQNKIDYSMCQVANQSSFHIYENMSYLIVMTDESFLFEYDIFTALQCGVNVILPNYPIFVEWFGTLPIYYDVTDIVDHQGQVINPFALLLRVKHILAETLASPVSVVGQEKLNQMFPPNGEIVTNYLAQQLK